MRIEESGGSEDLNFTFVEWPAEKGVAEHVNEEVDVLMLVLSGHGLVTVDGQRFEAGVGDLFLIRKGSTRSVRSASDDFRYINVHRRRRGLMPTARPGPQSGNKTGSSEPEAGNK